MNGRLLENLNLVELFPVVDLNTAGATGDWINLAQYKRAAIIFAASVGNSGEAPTVTVLQAKDTAGTGSKALNFTTFYTKTAATDLTGTPNWTKNTQASANTMTVASSGNKDKLWAVEFHAEELDDANGFTFLSVTIADVGSNAQLGYGLVLLGDPRFPCAPESMLTAIS